MLRKKPTLSKLVWYHKGTPGHKKIEDQEELVPGAGIQNPVFEGEQDVSRNILHLGHEALRLLPITYTCCCAKIATNFGECLFQYLELFQARSIFEVQI